MNTILGVLAGSSIRVMVIAIPVACILWGLRIRWPSTRHRVWSGVLICMLLLPLLSLWAPKIPVPLLPAYRDIPQQDITQGQGKSALPLDPDRAAVGTAVPSQGERASAITPRPRTEMSRDFRLGAVEFAGIVYLIGFSICAFRLFLGMYFAWRLSRRAVPDERGFCIANCNVPLTLGLLRPRILMPQESTSWDAQCVSSILIHEREHLRRHDPLVEWLALINRSLYWFHPLSWWLRRELAVLAEEACDQVVIGKGSDPESYAELLLTFARSVNKNGVLNPNWVSIRGGALMKRIQNIVADGSSPRISRFRLALLVPLCVAAIVVPAICQLTSAEQYASQNAVSLTSRAMGAEEEGNLDDAMTYYRQVLTTPADQRIYAAFAQFQIAHIQLQKANLAAAAREFDILAAAYPEYADLVGTLIAEKQHGIMGIYRSGIQYGQIGKVRDARYHHNKTRSEFSLYGLSVSTQSESSGGGEIVILTKEGSSLLAKVWMKPDRISPVNIRSRLRGALLQKVLQRIPALGYKVRSESVQTSIVNGKQSLSAIADYISDDGTPMIEYLAWIYTERTRFFVLAQVNASEFERHRPTFDQLTASAIVP